MFEKKPIRCLVIQTGTLYEVLLRLMSLRSVQMLYPHLEIHFLTTPAFVSIVKKVSWIKKVISDTKKNRHLLQEPWDLVVNGSSAETVKDLFLLPSQASLAMGYYHTKEGQLCTPDGWSQYLSAVSRSQVAQSIHLNDIWTTQLLTALQIVEGDPPFHGEVPSSSKGFFHLVCPTPIQYFLAAVEKKGVLISLQIEEGSATFWAQLIAGLLSEDPQIELILFGKGLENEHALFEELNHILSPPSFARLHSKIGELSFDVWTVLLSHSRLLITPFGPAVALASVLGTPMVYLSKGENFSECGPYGSGHCVLKFQDLQKWDVATVLWTVRRVLLQKKILSSTQRKSICPPPLLPLYVTQIRKNHEGGGVFYCPQNDSPLLLQDWFAQVVGHLGRHWFCGWVPELGKELAREQLTSELVQKIRSMQEAAEVLMKILKQAQAVAVQLAEKNAQLPSKKIMDVEDRKVIQNLGMILSQLDFLMERLAKVQPLFSFFVHLHQILMHHLQSKNLTDLGLETAQAYGMLYEGAEIVKNWTQVTLRLVRPVVLPSDENRKNWLHPEAPSA